MIYIMNEKTKKELIEELNYTTRTLHLINSFLQGIVTVGDEYAPAVKHSHCVETVLDDLRNLKVEIGNSKTK